MGIIICIGNPGSGKTLSVVAELVNSKRKITTYTNIIPREKELLPNIVTLKKSDIVKEDAILNLKGEPVIRAGKILMDKKLNEEFWKNAPKPLNVIIDEAHTVFNARNFASKENKIFSEWLALIRRVLGSTQMGGGDLILISQLDRRIDVIAREMATQIRFHRCFYIKTCKKCGESWQESNETSSVIWECPECNSIDIKKHSHSIHIFYFTNIENYNMWKSFSVKSYYSRVILNNADNYFKYYDTMQWDNLIS